MASSMIAFWGGLVVGRLTYSSRHSTTCSLSIFIILCYIYYVAELAQNTQYVLFDYWLSLWGKRDV